MNERLPLLVVVNGRPATGKTWLARLMSRELAIPAFSKDDFKEELASQLGARDREESRRLGAQAIDAMFRAARDELVRGSSVIVEAPLIAELASQDLQMIRAAVDVYVLQVFLDAEPPVILERYVARGRDGVHFLDESLIELQRALDAEFEPIADYVDETITVDTTHLDRLDYSALIERVRSLTALSE